MEGLLAHRAGVLHGILNGIDLEVWDSARDAFLAAPYDVAHLERKGLCKAALERELGWEPRSDGFLLGMVSRLTGQKGVDLVLRALPRIIEGGARLVVLGTGERALERSLAQAASTHPDRVAVRLAFDEGLAHRVEAGADAFLMPSRFEPCGLNQMYSQRYGTPPVARATGGLVDSIRDGGDDDAEASGFLFREASAESLAGAVRRAQAAWGEPARWRRLQQNGMRRDFGWAASALRYAQLYAAIARPGR
jgi:starch synthase